MSTTKHQAVFKRYGTRTDGDGFTFIHIGVDEPPELADEYIVLPRELFEALGSPDEITVTIEPGSVIQ